ncbi:MAG: hypothetical protein AAGC64_00055 [Bacteroidota bacterium]
MTTLLLITLALTVFIFAYFEYDFIQFGKNREAVFEKGREEVIFGLRAILKII